MSSSDLKNPVFMAKSFLAGGIAGMTSKTAVAPLDRIKILLQVHNIHYKEYGVFTGLRAIIRNEKFLSLYKGNGAQMVRIFPYAAVQYMSFEIYKRGLSILFREAESGKVNHSLKFFAGSMAGVTSAMMTYPLDLVRARLAFHVSHAGVDGIKIPTSIVGTLVYVFQNEGRIVGLYRGITPTVLAMIPYGGCNFYMFERLKHLAVEYMPTICGYEKDGKTILNIPSKLLCGGIAGAIGQTIVYPLDVARRRMQLSMTSNETKKFSEGFLKTLNITYKDYGVARGLYRGMSINYIRAVPMVAVSFSTYEVCKQLLGLETGI
ncbi:solute carrier family 25 member 16-like [Oppia nitens]|uniref:solute carrier family 25 member 16-like n=1 Tax=Oppia nitens TaxID=1686743 RepID=UPI0023DC9567|nr:solute carrier family 25 member 16-like [Oppia nitens]